MLPHFDPSELNRKLGVSDNPELAVLPSDAQYLWPLAHQLITCSMGQLVEVRMGESPKPTVGHFALKKLGRNEVHRRIKALTNAELVVQTTVAMEPHRLIKSPLFQWDLGNSPPDFEILSARIRESWVQSTGDGGDGIRPTPPSTVFRITDRGAAAVGAFAGDRDAARIRKQGFRAARLVCAKHPFAPLPGGNARSAQAVTEIFMARLWESPDLVRGWRVLHRRPSELLLPDAFVYNADGQLSHAVVHAAQWCECLVRRFHGLCSTRSVAYQIYGG